MLPTWKKKRPNETRRRKGIEEARENIKIPKLIPLGKEHRIIYEGKKMKI